MFYKNLFCQNNCKEAMNKRGGQNRGTPFNFFVVQKCLFLKLGFTPCKAEQPLRGMELQEKEKKKKKITGYRKSV